MESAVDAKMRRVARNEFVETVEAGTIPLGKWLCRSKFNDAYDEAFSLKHYFPYWTQHDLDTKWNEAWGPNGKSGTPLRGNGGKASGGPVVRLYYAGRAQTFGHNQRWVAFGIHRPNHDVISQFKGGGFASDEIVREERNTRAYRLSQREKKKKARDAASATAAAANTAQPRFPSPVIHRRVSKL